MPQCSLSVSHVQLIYEVLMPEAVARLVSDDLDLQDAEARATMEASYDFGCRLHPEPNQDEDHPAVVAVLTRVLQERREPHYKPWAVSGSNLSPREWAESAEGKQALGRRRVMSEEVLLNLKDY